MDDTACGDRCPFVKNGTCSDCSGCPNYIESWWTQQGATHPKLVKDCSPKRMMLQQQYLQLRVEQLTAEVQEARAQYVKVAGHLQQIIELSGSTPKSLPSEEYAKLPNRYCPVTGGLLLQSDHQVDH